MEKRSIYSDKAVFKKNPNFITRKIGDEVILMPVVEGDSEGFNYIYSLNESAAAVWDMIDGKNAIIDIVKRLAKNFETKSEISRRKLERLITDMKDIDAIIEVVK